MESANSGKKIVRTKSFEEFNEINWVATGGLVAGHLLSVYALTHVSQATWQALLYCFLLFVLGTIGIATGAHRLWSHKTYKAKLPLRIFLMVLQTLGCQGSVYIWARWHRLHHKHSDTRGDPHNPSRGFFYAHMGWLIMYDHQKFMRNAEGEIDSSDLEGDGVVMWQHRNYFWFTSVLIFGTMSFAWSMGWGDAINNLAFSSLAAMAGIHVTGLINSFAHGIMGPKPYDRFIRPTRFLLINLLTLTGEGDHNYHHVFPWDYKSSEHVSILNLPAQAIHLFHWMGLAYDLKFASPQLISKRAQRTGDGSSFKNCLH